MLFFYQFRLPVVFIILLSGYLSWSSPVHPAIKHKLRVTASMTQPSPQMQVEQSTTMPTQVQNENISGQQTDTRINSGALNQSNHQTKIQTSLSMQTLKVREREKLKGLEKGAHRKRKFSCNYPECEYTTPKHGNLIRHEIAHVIEKPFP